MKRENGQRRKNGLRFVFLLVSCSFCIRSLQLDGGFGGLLSDLRREKRETALESMSEVIGSFICDEIQLSRSPEAVGI